MVVLTTSEPTGRIVLTAGGAGPLIVRLGEIENPDRQAISVHVELEVVVDRAVRRFDLGAATPFPPNQPGAFVLSLPAAATAAIASGGRPAAVALELVPVASQEPLAERIAVAVQVSLERS